MPYVTRLVDDGRLGFKTGEGFRKWTHAEQAALRKRVTDHLKRMAELYRPHMGGKQ